MLFFLLFANVINPCTAMYKQQNEKTGTIIALSQQILLAAKTKEPTDSLVRIISAISSDQLAGQLTTDDEKKAFWINMYNAYTQIILQKNPAKYTKRNAFFGDRQIAIGGKKLSLDDIEHGLLRRSKVKWSLGHFNKLFPSAFEKMHRVDKLDYRIHFALNCGAASCPPIAFYSPDELSRQLDMATSTFLKGDATYDEQANTVALPAILGWFRGDFGGKKGMLQLLKKLQIVPESKKPVIRFKKYDWNLFLENYKSE